MFVSLRLFSLPSLFFFFTDTAPTEIYTLSLHDALPICDCGTPAPPARRERGGGAPPCRALRAPRATCWRGRFPRASRRTGCPPRRPCAHAGTKNPGNGFLQSTETPEAGVLTRAFILLDERVRVVVVDRLEVLGFHHVRLDALVQVEHGGDVAHHVLDELRVVVGALGDEIGRASCRD